MFHASIIERGFFLMRWWSSSLTRSSWRRRRGGCCVRRRARGNQGADGQLGVISVAGWRRWVNHCIVSRTRFHGGLGIVDRIKWSNSEKRHWSTTLGGGNSRIQRPSESVYSVELRISPSDGGSQTFQSEKCLPGQYPFCLRKLTRWSISGVIAGWNV